MDVKEEMLGEEIDADNNEVITADNAEIQVKQKDMELADGEGTSKGNILTAADEECYTHNNVTVHGDTQAADSNVSMVHVGGKPYECQVCGRSFNHKSNMTAHIKAVHLGVHMGEELYECKHCGKSFKRRRAGTNI